jgi:hypothetical protein
MRSLLSEIMMADAITRMAGTGDSASVVAVPGYASYKVSWIDAKGSHSSEFPQSWALLSLDEFQTKFAEAYLQGPDAPKHKWGFRFSYGFKWDTELTREELLRVIAWYQSRHEEMRNDLRQVCDIARMVGEKGE